jgi:hypothetical protein
MLRKHQRDHGSPYPFLLSAEPLASGGLNVESQKLSISSIWLRNFAIYVASDCSLTLLNVPYSHTRENITIFQFHVDLTFFIRIGGAIRPYNVSDFLDEQIVELLYQLAPKTWLPTI